MALAVEEIEPPSRSMASVFFIPVLNHSSCKQCNYSYCHMGYL
jgi:hypothetical protein